MDAEARDHEAPLSDVEGGSGRIERLRRERDFYRQLLQLARATDIKALLDEALAQIVALSGASQGYLEIGHRDDGDRPSPWWLANGFDDEELVTVRRAISSGIIAQAIATGRAVRTASAIADPRFSSRGSVKRNAIGSVLCAPVAAPSEAPSGVVYLQGREPFSEEAERDLAFFVEHFAPLVERLLRQGRASDADPTREHRAKLVDHDELVGRTPAMAEILKTVTLVAPLDLHLLITGPTGTGKNALARLVATNSARRGGPFVEVNCAALPDELFESELFGAVPGAHSTAHRALPGKVDAAEGGTLFLDEVAELSPRAQAKLLQFLQSKTFFPLGSTAPVTADVRIIAATNVGLHELRESSRFRQDLLHRLAVMPIDLPALERRRDDVVPLARHLCRTICQRHGLPLAKLSANAENTIHCEDWPGNVRELGNVVERGVIVAHGAGRDTVTPADLFPEREATADRPPTFQEATRRFQKGLVVQALQTSQWNVAAAAERLDLTRSYLYKLISALGIAKPHGPGR